MWDVLGNKADWTLVRRVRGGNKFHPSSDHLVGTDVYGTKPATDPETSQQTFSIKYDHEAFDEFLFATGDEKIWMVCSKTAIGSPFDNPDDGVGYYDMMPRNIIASSISTVPYKAKWINHDDSGSNSVYPMISVVDFDEAIDAGKVLYVEDSYGNSSTPMSMNVLPVHNGLNVWIRAHMPPPTPVPPPPSPPPMSMWDHLGGGPEGWTLVRRVRPGDTWHPSSDRLAGTDVYGVKPLNGANQADATFSIKFDDWTFDEILFATGDEQIWLSTFKIAIGAPFVGVEDSSRYYSNALRTIKMSSDRQSVYQARWFNRDGVSEDPWISTEDHDDAIANGKIVYGEDSFGGAHATNILPLHNGANVWVKVTAPPPSPPPPAPPPASPSSPPPPSTPSSMPPSPPVNTTVSMATSNPPPCQGTKVWEQSGAIIDPNPGETVPGVHFNGDDFTFSVKLTPTDPGTTHGGMILGRHTNGVAAGFGLVVMRSGHINLNLYSDYDGYDQQATPWTSDCVENTSSVDHNGIWAGDLMSPTPLSRDVEQTVTLERVGQTLSLAVDGVVGCTVTLGSWRDTAGRVSPDTLLLGNEGNGQNPFKGTMSDAYICTNSVAGTTAVRHHRRQANDKKRPLLDLDKVSARRRVKQTHRDVGNSKSVAPPDEATKPKAKATPEETADVVLGKLKGKAVYLEQREPKQAPKTSSGERAVKPMHEKPGQKRVTGHIGLQNNLAGLLQRQTALQAKRKTPV